MVLLGGEEQSAREYLESTGMLPSLESAMDEMLKHCGAPENRGTDPVRFLASWLMRYNPRYTTGDDASAEQSALSRAALAKVPYEPPPATAPQTAENEVGEAGSPEIASS